MKKKILVTGASGYIGSTVAKALSRFDCRLHLLSRRDNQVFDITKKNFWQSVLKNVDIVFHFAGQTSSSFANNHPIEDTQTNLLPIVRLIETCQEHHYSPDVIFAGTVTQAGNTRGRINEDFKDNPITVYDINKLTAETYLRYYSDQAFGRAVILRLCNIYGPGPSNSKPDRGIVNLMIKKALKNELITVFGKGNYVRDYLYIDDVVNAFIKAAINIDKTKGKYYVIGTGVGHTILQMATAIKEEVKNIIDKEPAIIFSPFPKNTSVIEYRNFIADSTRFKKDTGWSAKISLKEGIKKTVNYYKNGDI